MSPIPNQEKKCHLCLDPHLQSIAYSALSPYQSVTQPLLLPGPTACIPFRSKSEMEKGKQKEGQGLIRKCGQTCLLFLNGHVASIEDE